MPAQSCMLFTEAKKGGGGQNVGGNSTRYAPKAIRMGIPGA